MMPSLGHTPKEKRPPIEINVNFRALIKNCIYLPLHYEELVVLLLLEDIPD